MCSFSHPNVLGMEGICLDPESQSPYLILPFMKNGDLKSYLRKKRSICNLVDVSYPEVSSVTDAVYITSVHAPSLQVRQ